MSITAPVRPFAERLPTVREQLDRLIAAGLAEAAGVSPEELRSWASKLRGGPSSVLVVHPCLVPASRLVPLLRRAGRPGFVASDFGEPDGFEPLAGIALPAHPFYLVHEPSRGDDLASASPTEALVEIEARGRRPLTVNEGISWVLQHAPALEPGRGFTTLGSRSPRGDGSLDGRAPALWISGGSVLRGRGRRGAPTLGWSGQRSRTTWLGVASAAR
jgi:hypothetical protein